MKDPRDWIAYVGSFSCSGREAAGYRVEGVSRALAEGGWNVRIACGDGSPSIETHLWRSTVGTSVTMVGVGERSAPEDSVFRKVLRRSVLAGKRARQWLNSQDVKPTCIFYYGDDAPFLYRVLKWAHHQDVPVVVDVVEWYDGRHLAFGGRLSPLNISAKVSLIRLNTQADGILAISSLLENYYSLRGPSVVRVPALVDSESIRRTAPAYQAVPGKLRLAYAGNSGNGRKDKLYNVIEGVVRLNAEGEQIELTIMGPDEKELLQSPPLRSRELSKLPSYITAMGWVSPDRARHIVGMADFMPLLRPDERFANAGFPTKLAESLALGTPILCNITGDIGHYVRNGAEGFICRDDSVEAFTEALRRALGSAPEHREEMRHRARSRAERSLDYRAHVDTLKEFVGNVLQRSGSS